MPKLFVSRSVTTFENGGTSWVITVDAPMVQKCVTKALAKHTFAPPGDTITVTIVFQLSDMC